MSESTPTSSPLSEAGQAAILSTIQSADSALLKRYMEFLGMPPELIAVPYYMQEKTWISKTTFARFLKTLTGQPESPIRPIPVSGKRPLSPSPGTIIHSVSEDEENATPSPVARKAKRQRQSKAPSNPEKVIITRSSSVNKMDHRFSLPSVWPIPREPTAVVVDLTGQTAPLDAEGKPFTLDAWLRQEDQDSWKVRTNGSRARPGIPVALLGGTLCRKVLLSCNGVVVCSELDPQLLEGYERWEEDLDKCQELFKAQDVQRTLESASAQSVMANFYRAVSHGTCPKAGCLGVATMINYTTGTLPTQGKYYFVGCSKWSPADRHGHIHHSIPAYIDESELLKLFSGQKLDVGGMEALEGRHCTQIFHPSTGLKLKKCKMTHLDSNGSLIQGTMQYQHCPATMAIWVPLDDTDLRAVVLLGSLPHNHPCFPSHKPSAEAKEAAVQCFLAAGGIQARPTSVDSGPTTLALLGQPLSLKYPAFQDKRKLRDFVSAQKLEEAPLGLEWMGIINAAEEDRKLPLNQQYIRSTISHQGIHLVVTMNPVLAELIHSARSLACDFTFKRVYGDFNEWEVATFLDGINQNITLARLYCDSMSLGAYRLLWDTFFRDIEVTTGRALQFKAFHKAGNLIAIICDADAPQAQALGEYYLKINRPNVSGITEDQPECILLHAFKSCIFHFNQNANGLAKKGATRADIDRIMSYPSLKEPEARLSFRTWCEEHSLEAVQSWYKNKLGLPWYLPSVNPHESPMKWVDWITTPRTTNASESAHARSNDRTGIRLPLVSAISGSKLDDQQVAERIQSAFQTCILPNKHNSLQDRMIRGLSRAKFKYLKAQGSTGTSDIIVPVDVPLEEGMETEEAEAELVPPVSAGYTLKIKSGDFISYKKL